MKRVVLIYVLLSFVFLVLFAFTGYSVYYLIMDSIHYNWHNNAAYIIEYATFSCFGLHAMAAVIIIMVLIKKTPACKPAMDTAKEKRIKKLEAKIERLKSDDKTNT